MDRPKMLKVLQSRPWIEPYGKGKVALRLPATGNIELKWVWFEFSRKEALALKRELDKAWEV